jgi:hypothetical protein
MLNRAAWGRMVHDARRAAGRPMSVAHIRAHIA